MRQRVLRVAVVAATVTTLLLIVPLSLFVHQYFLATALNNLERESLRATVSVDSAFAQGDPVELPTPHPGIRLALIDATGHLIAGDRPSAGAIQISTALSGRASQGQSVNELVAAVPVTAAEKVIGVMIAWRPAKGVWQQTALAWVGLVGLGLAGLMVGGLVARREARVLSEPLESLAAAAKALGEGDFNVRTKTSGVRDVDVTANALNVAASRIGRMVAREQEFAANASHQLRNPLTALRLALEHALTDPNADLTRGVQVAIESADQLQETITELLSNARSEVASSQSREFAETLVAPLIRQWLPRFSAAGRKLQWTLEQPQLSVRCGRAAIQQILDALIDNALSHGVGTVDVRIRESAGALALDVRDEGGVLGSDVDVFARGWSSTGSSGIGLAVARELAVAHGGRLLLTATRPQTTFTLLLPTANEANSSTTD